MIIKDLNPNNSTIKMFKKLRVILIIDTQKAQNNIQKIKNL